MITVADLELRAGSRILVTDTTLRVQPGDRIGLVGRNGSGKTTVMRVLAGRERPFRGTVQRTGQVDYLPQQPGLDDPHTLVRDRVLSARGLDTLLRDLEKAQVEMAEPADEAALARAVQRYGELEERFTELGGYAADNEAAQVCAHLGLPERVLTQTVSTLSGGQRRRVELARILFGASTDHGAGTGTTLLLDEPTNHLDIDSVTWLRSFLTAYAGGLVVISHDTGLLAEIANGVWSIDAGRGEIDIYNTDWATYQTTRAADDQRLRRERGAAESKATSLRTQAARMGANATRAAAAKQMARRADTLLADTATARRGERTARIRFPAPAACGRTPLTATGLTKSFGPLEVFDGVDLAVDRGSKVVILGRNGAGKTTLLRILAGVEQPDAGRVVHGHGLRLGYFAQEHDTLDLDDGVWANVRHQAPDAPEQQLKDLLGSFLLTGEQLEQPAGTLSGGERTRLTLATLVSGAANVLLLDEPTNNLDPASRAQVLDALGRFEGAVILVSHDPGAVAALRPERVIVLPDGTEDLFSDDYLDLITLA
ncbi:ABC-F family ATP-binding cassette domain-containing protein [Pseudonocardia abyssalis]|uniref:ABC-F family ATP-binding cassette domain-containing protein n=1 Tax=Pseudonocardia abyssalis TaxID=2792008 RepID=A0ABS6US09_9PSEU|nr:ABC-F family ATP-binding cassette domain-containing protein [Pseudonocardia abyssalis]MBW0114548.1 ABC-F family ATP-binding cassette domain-containing protein [Pseudonocardia abyssalis]MBW0135053.1 ABC-F family ATP-binding cassette domain-containing protein [Pseudonocardia abyssalis]